MNEIIAKNQQDKNVKFRINSNFKNRNRQQRSDVIEMMMAVHHRFQVKYSSSTKLKHANVWPQHNHLAYQLFKLDAKKIFF